MIPSAMTLVLALSLAGPLPAPARETSRLVGETRLGLTVVLYDAETVPAPPSGPAAPDAGPAPAAPAGPEIVFLSSVPGPGDPRMPPGTADRLRRAFGLPALRVRERGTAELTWLTAREVYDAAGKFERRAETRSEGRFRTAVTHEGAELVVTLRPKTLDPAGSAFLFEVEVARTAGGSGGAAALEPLARRDVLWNFQGPLTIGFLGARTAEFLDLAIRLETGAFGGRLASGFSKDL